MVSYLLSSSLILLLTLTGVVSAHPRSIHPYSGIASRGTHLPLVTKSLENTGIRNVAAADRARAAMLLERSMGRRSRRSENDVSVTSNAMVYLVSVDIGSPPTKYTLLVDTGSSNTWIGASKSYNPTGTSHDTGHTVSMEYGGGSFSGREYTDRFSFSDHLTVNSQSFGVASSTDGFEGGLDGVLGIGPTDLTVGSLSDSRDPIATVTDNLFSQGTIPKALLGVFFAPFAENVPGVLSFGTPAASLYTGDIHYVSVTQSRPAGGFWGIDQSITYGDTQIMGQAAGILDTGTSMIQLATDAFKAYQQVLGATLDEKIGMLKLPKDDYAKIQPLNFNVEGKTLTLVPNAQIWPRKLNKRLGGDDDHIYFVIGDLGSSSEQKMSFILGYAFLERFYTVYDSGESKIGFASTKYTQEETN